MDAHRANGTSAAHHGGSGAGDKGESSVPDVPGVLIDDQQAYALRDLVARLCRLKHNRFPGAQPVSFTRASLDMLKEEE